MKPRSYVHMVLTTMTALAIASCAPTIRVPIVHPPEIDLSDTRRVAIGEITGPAAKVFANDLTTGLFESGRFELLDRQHLTDLLDEMKLSSSGIVDESSEVEIGNLVGNAALVFGNVSGHRYSEESSIGDPKVNDDGDTTRIHRRVGKARVSATLQLTDLRTGRIIAAKQVHAETEATQTAKNRAPSRIDTGALLGQARADAVQQFVQAFIPQTTFDVVRFEKSDASGIKQGLQLAELGDLVGAEQAFGEVTNLDPNNAAAWFNLGVTQMAQGKYDVAVDALTEAHRIDPKTRFASEIARVRRFQARTQAEKTPIAQ
jgi:hypothetical protein